MTTTTKSKPVIHARGHVPNADSMDFLRLKINAAREFHHIDGAKYAELTGCGMSTSYARTRDIRHMTVGELYAFTNAIGVTLRDLLDRY